MGIIFEDSKYKDLLDFMVKYDKIAPDGEVKKANIRRFAKIGLDRKKFKIHLSLDRYYFLTQVTDDVEYYKAYLRLNKDDSLEFYKTGYYQNHYYVMQFGRHRVKIPDNIITNFYQAKRSLREERLALL